MSSMAEEERAVERAYVEEREGRQVLVLRWNTGKTSAGRLFGRYGEGGRPDFFRLLFGALAGSLRERLGPRGEEVFNRIRDSAEFRKTSKEIFEDMKSWFFSEIAPKYGLDKGDIFMVITEIEVDLTSGALRWNRERTEFYYWVRSDRCQQLAGADVGERMRQLEEENRKLREENERLRGEVERLRKELADIKERLAGLIRP